MADPAGESEYKVTTSASNIINDLSEILITQQTIGNIEIAATAYYTYSDNSWKQENLTQLDSERYYRDLTTSETLDEAKEFAAAAVIASITRRLPSAASSKTPLAWIAFTQLFYLLILLSPGVYFIGTIYQILAQLGVIVATMIHSAPYIDTAARFSTGVAIGNVLLSALIWKTSYGTLNQVTSGIHCAIIIAVAVLCVGSNQFLIQQAALRPSLAMAQ